MKKKKCMVCRMLLLCCLLLLGAVPVKADNTGKVSLKLSKGDVAMTLYQVAEAEENGLYYTEAFSKCDVKLETLSQAEAQMAADALAGYVKEQKLKGTTQKTDKEGTLSFTGLADGVYLLIQTGSQEMLTVQNMLFSIPQKTDGEKNYNVVLEAKSAVPGGAVILNKTDSQGNALEGAVFTLQVLNGNDWKELKTALVTNKKGQIVITDLPFGSYCFVETEAPKGYQLLTEPVSFEIKKAGQVSLVNGIYQKNSKDVAELAVINEKETPPDTNPPGNPGNSTPGIGTPNVKTGDDSPILFLVILLLLAAAGIVVSLWFRKNN